MNITINHILATLTIIIALIAGNVYQYGNPQVVEVPAGQTAIDSTAWVKRSAYATRGLIIDSLSAQNEKLAGRVRQSKDRIANYTAVTGRLRLTIDSLQSRPPVRLDSLLGLANNAPPSYSDTAVAFQQPFADSLFSVQSQVTFKWPYLDNELTLTQQRDIRLDVVNTINDNQSRILTYVTSPDFDSLRYQSYTELHVKNELPTFWIGTGVGVLGTLGLFLIAK